MKNRAVKNEFVKSLAVLLLALILLVSAVLAWFVNTETSDVSDFAVSIEAEDGGIYLGDGVALQSSIVLPCATKVDDSTISAEDFSKAIYIESFNINASESVTKAAVTVDIGDSEGLHYYIDGNYGSTDTAVSLAEEIKDFSEDRDIDLTIDFSMGDQSRQRTVAVVFWADYTDSTPQVLAGGSLNFNSLIKFSAIE